MKGVLLHRGAEADLYLSRMGRWDTVVKRRIRKRYRHPELDSRIRRERTAKEATVLHEARKLGVRTPVVLSVDLEATSIVMTHVKGALARDSLERVGDRSSLAFLAELGRQVGLLHSGGIVHGDLTTSNIIIVRRSTPFLLDFGLSLRSSDDEDRGVDLHLLKKSLAATHVVEEKSSSKIVSRGYKEILGPKEAHGALSKAAEISRRGRYFALR
jgi:TP53 regulating kinase-like protein